jgi:hypothetical protein
MVQLYENIECLDVHAIFQKKIRSNFRNREHMLLGGKTPPYFLLPSVSCNPAQPPQRPTPARLREHCSLPCTAPLAR